MIPTVARNILANVAGAGLAMAVFLVVVPIYLRLLGAEAYGLIGLFTTVMVASTVLDLGLGATLNREVARLTARAATTADDRDVAITLEAGGWGVGLLAGALFAIAAPVIAGRWLTFSHLAPGDVRGALWLMAAALPALVARSLYLAGLNGLQRQGLANLVQVTGTVVRAIASVTALRLIEPVIGVFFTVQVTLLLVETLALAVALRRALPVTARGGRVRPAALRSLLGFSFGVSGTMLLGFALMSIDQIVLSAILPLAEFGYYTLAVSAANAVGQLVQPVTTAVYPRFSQLVEQGDDTALAEEYHFFSQLVAVLVLPLGAILIAFPGELLVLWTHDSRVAQAAAVVLALRAIGTVLNALMHVPHVLQLAFGWSTLGAGVNAVALLLVAPATVALSLAAGGAGAAGVYIALNLGAIVAAMARMHRRVLPGELLRWYARLVRPAVAVAMVAALSRATMPEGLGTIGLLTWLGATGAVLTGVALAAAGGVRRRVVAATAQRRAAR
ncbi:MAG TPA: oligosaccharide flippase family protein [Methylomirabilota bacterium]|nr:oligosaccharide flippase family protein [Methylomirabilota bacterium]